MDIFGQFLTQNFVYLLSGDFCAKALLQQAHGHLSGAEARHLSLLAEVLQGLVNVLLVVCLHQRKGQQGVHFIYFLE